jgi:hypothetical protein
VNFQFLPCISYATGLQTSAALWRLIRPNPGPGEITTHLYDVILDLNNVPWAIVDIDSLVNVPGGSSGSGIIAVVQAAIAAGFLISSDLSWIESAITAADGQTVAISSLLPDDLLAQGLTYSQMVANGSLSGGP